MFVPSIAQHYKNMILKTNNTRTVRLDGCPDDVHLKIKAFQVESEKKGEKLTIPEAYFQFIRKAKI